MNRIARVFVIIGGLNLGLMGIGLLVHKDLNAIALFSKFHPLVPTVSYLLIGVCSIWLMF